MKITSIRLVSGPSTIEFSFKNPRGDNPYNIKAVTGLDPGDILTQFGGTSALGGGVAQTKYYALSLTNRQLVFKIGMNPNFEMGSSYSDLRDNIYRLIYSSRVASVTIQFLNNSKVFAETEAFISKIESDHFTSTQEVTLTVNCVEPMLRSPDKIDIAPATLDIAGFVVNDYVSTAPHGFQCQFLVTSGLNNSGFIIYDPIKNDWAFEIRLAVQFNYGDVINFNSDTGKYVYIWSFNGGLIRHISDAIIPGSVWPLIFPGENNLAIKSTAALTLTEFTHTPAYWGV